MPQRRSRSRNAIIIIATGAVATGAAIAVALAIRGSSSSANSLRLITATARRATLTQTVDAPFTAVLNGTATLNAPSAGAVVTPASGTVTQLSLTPGQLVRPLSSLLQINALDVYGIPSAIPFYRNLVQGDTGFDVMAVQDALTSSGYDTGGVDGNFGATTTDAIDRFQSDHALTETGQISLDTFVSYPPAALVLDVKTALGQHVQPGGAIADLAVANSLIAQAQIGQLDFTRVQSGQQVQLDFDALPGTRVQGVVLPLPPQAAPAQPSAGTSTPVEYNVNILPVSLPSGLRAGMTGQAHIVVQQRTNAVIVPTTAIGGSTDSPTVQVVINGKPVTKPVVVGMTTASETEIITGVQPGQTLVAGTQAPAVAPPSTSTPRGVFGGGGGGPGGGGTPGGGGGGGRGGGPGD